MDRKKSNYVQVSRCVWDAEHKGLSNGAKLLFWYLNELEMRFCKKGVDTFTRTDEQLAEDLNISIGTLKKYKKNLKQYGSDLVEISPVHFTRKDQKKSISQFTGYKILK